MKIKGILSSLLILSFLLFSGGCQKQQSKDKTNRSFNVYNISSHTDLQLRQILSSSCTSEKVYILGTTENGSKEIVEYLPADQTLSRQKVAEESSKIAAASDGVWVATGQKTAASLYKIASDGDDSIRILLDNTGKVVDLAVDRSESIYVATASAVFIYTKDGTFNRKIDFDKNNIGTLLHNKNGEILIQADSRSTWGGAPMYGIGSSGISEVTALYRDNQRVNTFLSFSGAGGDYDLLMPQPISLGGTSKYVRAEQGIIVYGIDTDSGNLTPVFDTAGLDVFGAVIDIGAEGENYRLLLEAEAGCTMVELQKTDEKKEVITVGRLENNASVSYAIMSFNRNSRAYFAAGKLYADEQQLQLDLVSDKAPDVLSLQTTNYEVYAKHGLFRNIYDFLDADSALNREDLFESVLKALEYDDNVLYQICPTYSLVSCAVHEAYIHDMGPITLESLQEIAAQSTDTTLFGSLRYSDMLNALLGVQLPAYLDIETGVVQFDCPQFIDFLKFIKEMDERAAVYTQDTDSYRDKTALLQVVYIQSIAQYKLWSMSYPYMELTGVPTESASEYQLYSPVSFAIVSNTGNENAAWAFIKTLLSEEYQEGVRFLPILKSVFQQWVENAKIEITEEEVTVADDPLSMANGGNLGVNSQTYKVPPLENEEAEKLYSMIHAIQSVSVGLYENPVLEIIGDEVRALFAGDKSAEEVAKNIQTRVLIYVSERE